MFIKFSSQNRRRAGSLMETVVGVGVFSLAAMALASLYIFSIRSFAAMSNYTVLDQYNRQAMDQMTMEIRQAQKVIDYVTNATMAKLTILNGDGNNVTWQFEKTNRRVLKIADGRSRIILTNCDLLGFNLGMRPPPPPTNTAVFDFYPVVMGTNWQQTVKVVQLTWKTAMTISPTARVNSENVQTASIIIRKQQD